MPLPNIFKRFVLGLDELKPCRTGSTSDFIRPSISDETEIHKPKTATTLVRVIKLLYYRKYEPADSDI